MNRSLENQNLRNLFYTATPKLFKVNDPNFVDFSTLQPNNLYYIKENVYNVVALSGFQRVELEVNGDLFYLYYSTDKNILVFRGNEVSFKNKKSRAVFFNTLKSDVFRYFPKKFLVIIDPINQYLQEKKYQIQCDLSSMTSALNEKKANYIDAFERWNDINTQLKSFENKITELKKFVSSRKNVEMKHGLIYITIRNVVAEDSAASHEDIELGDITFSVNLATLEIKISNGSQPRKRGSCWIHHPHEYDISHRCCFGTLDTDVINAARSMQMDVLMVLLTKWANSYNSNDCFGERWALWTEDGYKTLYCERLEEYFNPEQAVRSSYESDYIPNERAVYCSYEGTYIWDDRSIEIDGDYYPTDCSVIVNINGAFHLRDQTVVIDGTRYLESDCTFSITMEEWLAPNSNLVQLDDGDYVTQEYYDSTIDTVEAVAEVVNNSDSEVVESVIEDIHIDQDSPTYEVPAFVEQPEAVDESDQQTN